MKKKVFAFLFSLPLLACNSNPELETFYYREFGIFNSEFAVTYNAERSLEEEIDTFLSAFTLEADPYSQHKGVNGVYEINQTNEPVEVSDDLYNAIDRAWTIKSETEGYFNPLIFNLSSLWKKTLFGGIIPDPDYVPTSAKIDAAKTETPALLEVDKILKDHGIKEYLVNGGTSSLAFGVFEGGGPFRVRLKYTGDDETSLRYYVKKAFTSTSAVYEQYRVVDGVTYSHVINTVTGIPVTDYSMAFLEGEDSTRLDAYSTACMIAGIDKTKSWEKAYNFKAALFEDKDGLAELVYENSQLNKA